MSPSNPPVLRVLVVCQANQCRSPMAHGFLQAGLRAVGVEASVASAGFLPGGVQPAPHAVSVMADRGINISQFRSHTIRTVDIEAADLILAMDPHHVREIVATVADAFSHTFTIRELDRLGRAAGPLKEGESVLGWLERLGTGRNPADLMPGERKDGIEDPMGGSRREFERTAVELDTLVWAIVDMMVGYKPQA